MSKSIRDEHGHEIYNITTGQCARVTQNGKEIGTCKDNGDIVAPSGAVIGNVGENWRNR